VSSASSKKKKVREKPIIDATQKEFIRQFGSQKGQQYYGAIRELEEFLDPGVLNDEDFKIN
jgi:hypothetical protein